jgi:hypothetical protein
MRFIWTAAVAVVLSVSHSCGSERLVATTVMGYKLFWTTDDESYDTLGWKQVISLYTKENVDDHSSMSSAQSLLQANGIRVLRLRNTNAVSLAILAELGYRVIVLSQWNGEPEGYIQVAHVSGYNVQHLRTDFLWEIITGAKVQEDRNVVAGRTAKLLFGDYGYCAFPCDADIAAKAGIVQGTTEDIELEFKGGERAQVNILRRIHQAYLIADAKKKPSAIVAEIEAEMDKLKLDLSYKPPEIVEVKFDKTTPDIRLPQTGLYR